jgi:hypothetical protein
MTHSFFHYLIESSVYSLVFFLIYKWIFSDMTHFKWMRAYLLASFVLSMVLPLVTLPEQWYTALPDKVLINKSLTTALHYPTDLSAHPVLDSTLQSGFNANILPILFFSLTLLYLFGAFYKTVVLIRNLESLRNCIKNNPKQKEGNCWIVHMSHESPAFSFFNFIFINDKNKKLSGDEFQQIKNHELLHAKQYHSLDILFVELTSILFWFNPVIKYLKNALQEVHEYLADENIISAAEIRTTYTHMLLNLVSEAKTYNISSGFSGKQIGRRILMLTKTRSLNRHKLMFTLIIPVAAILLVSFSGLDGAVSNDPSQHPSHEFHSIQEYSPRIGHVRWIDNAVFNDDQLNAVLNLQQGDEYSREDLNKRIWLDRDGIATLYFDQGYVFFNAEINEIQTGNTVDLNIRINEGIRGKIGIILIKGNRKVSVDEILGSMVIHPGDWFSKTKIMQSVEAIKVTDEFMPDQFEITPIPDPVKSTAEYAVVNLEFQVTEK